MKQLIQKNLQEQCSHHSLDKWFKPLNIYYDEKDTKLTVVFPHVFFEPWFIEQGKHIFEETVEKIGLQTLGLKPDIEYVISKTHKKKRNVFLHSDTKIQVEKTFENFFYNKKNEFPIAAAQDVSKETATPTYNPFIIFGKSSTGKTHILQAIYANSSKFNNNIFWGNSEDFYNNILSQGLENFIKEFDIFIIDDLQYDDNNLDFQQKIIQFIDICVCENKQLIFATSKSLTAKNNFNEKLQSRLSMGLIIKLSKPDIDVRMRFVLASCQEQELKISKNQHLMIAQHCENMSIIQGIILKVKAFKKHLPRKLQDSDIENILFSVVSSKKSICAQDIISITSNYFNISENNMLEDLRQTQIVQARQIAMYLCRDLLGLSYPAIGKFFGGKDHSTVMYSIKKIKKLINTNKDTQQYVTEIKQKCLAL